jgi:hypothetical protein
MVDKEISQRIEIATKLVQSWPAWKQNILVQSAQPKVQVPRVPVNNQTAANERKESGK